MRTADTTTLPLTWPRPSPRRAAHCMPQLRTSLRRHWSPALCCVVVLVDHTTKAMQPTGGFVVNTGAAAVLPSALGEALWENPTFGAATDTLATILLLVGLNLTRRMPTTTTRAGATAILAGLLSNLADRLGAASLFHADLPRGSIDWVPVPLWPTARTNLADVAVALGALVLAFQGLKLAARAVRAVIGRTRAIHLAAATAAVVGLATWTTFWQANRQAALTTSPRPPLVACSPGVAPAGVAEIVPAGDAPPPPGRSPVVARCLPKHPKAACGRTTSPSPSVVDRPPDRVHCLSE